MEDFVFTFLDDAETCRELILTSRIHTLLEQCCTGCSVASDDFVLFKFNLYAIKTHAQALKIFFEIAHYISTRTALNEGCSLTVSSPFGRRKKLRTVFVRHMAFLLYPLLSLYYRN